MSDSKTETDRGPTDGAASIEVAKSPPQARKRVTRKASNAPVAAVFDTVETAAAKLGVHPTALRARLRRAQRLENGSIVADVGGGITAFKFGSSWRIRFPEA
jgi:hypothetical protein